MRGAIELGYDLAVNFIVPYGRGVQTGRAVGE